MGKIKSICFLLGCLGSWGFADGGFFPVIKNLPPFLQTVEQNVVTFLGPHFSLGTGLIVKVISHGKHRRAYVLSDHHVLSICAESNRTLCPLQVLHRMQTATRSYPSSAPPFWPAGLGSWRAEVESVVKDDPESDLTLVVVGIPDNAVVNEELLFNDVSLPTVDEYNSRVYPVQQIFAIGSPDVTMRTEWRGLGRRVANVTYWSQGRLMFKRKSEMRGAADARSDRAQCGYVAGK